MKRFGLIGKNISYSKSKVLHETINSKVIYDLISLNNEEEIKNYLDLLKKGTYVGFNITIPYKEKVIPYLDEVSLKALKIGAVNTIYYKDKKLIGTNTDYDGFKALLQLRKIDLNNKKIVILGSGGAAKAVYNVLKDLNYKVIVASIEKEVTYNFEKIISWDKIDNSYDIYINATPVGTYPNVNESPIDPNIVKGKTVIDLIYNPASTKLMKSAKVSYNGYDMLIMQAIKAQEIWFDNKFDITLEQVLKIKEQINE